jgi:hypothetical protein
MSTGRRRGAKPLTARDWIFGSRPRRLALRYILNTTPPEKGWTKTEIAKGSEVSRHGGADEHIDGLIALGLLTERGGRYWPDDRDPLLRDRIAEVVQQLETVPERRIDEVLADLGA